MPNPTIAESSFSHVINAPIERVDIADWLLHLPNAEYQRCCPPAHIACGATTIDDGRPMSTNVELIGENLMIQQYIGEITDPDHCRMVSTSDVFTPAGRTKIRVVWDLSVEPLNERSCEFTNHILGIATDEFLATLAEHNIAIEQAAATEQAAASAHNAKETPLFAQSIERRALARPATGAVLPSTGASPP
jgi:hypothetical protein